MTEINTDQFYSPPDSFLQQGDIFRIDLVSPAADEIQRIFRSKDGRHGSIVFEENCDARVFSRIELDNLLNNAKRSDLHTQPFRPTIDGQDEMVVVFARLFKYFIIDTQTCDISEQDHKPLPWASILPVITLEDMCKTVLFPFDYTSEPTTIHDFVTKQYPDSDNLESSNENDYSNILREIIKKWLEFVEPKNLEKEVNRIKNYLDGYYNKKWVFSLPYNQRYNVPESHVDFTTIFTIPRDKLVQIQGHRFVRIESPYRDDFAQKFGTFFSRIALPTPMKPQKLK